MDESVLIGLGIAVFLGLIPANIAQSKGHNFWLWWLYGWSIFIVAFIHSLLLKPKQSLLESVGRQCPACAETIKYEATVCRYCGTSLPKLNLFHCAGCGTKFPEGLDRCPGCGARLEY